MGIQTSKETKTETEISTANIYDKKTLLVLWFARNNCEYSIPNDIIYLIELFYGNNFIGFVYIYNNGFDIDFDNSFDNITQIYPHKQHAVMLTNLNEVVHSFHGYSGSFNNYITASGNDNGVVSVISKGAINSKIYLYTNKHKLYCSQTNMNDWKSVDIKHIFKSNIIQIECGNKHTLFLTRKGDVYGCGKNNYFQLTNQFEYDSFIKSISKLTYITDSITTIGCGKNSSFTLNSNNILSSFGDNNHGLLGINDFIMDCDGYINVIQGYSFKTMDIMGHHIGCMTYDNNVYLWGKDSFGQCGYQKNGHDLRIPKLLDNDIFVTNEEKIDSIRCGFDHTIIRTVNKQYLFEYYSFGNNEDKQLLFNIDTPCMTTPTKISKEYIKYLTKNDEPIIDLIPGCGITFIVKQKNWGKTNWNQTSNKYVDAFKSLDEMV